MASTTSSSSSTITKPPNATTIQQPPLPDVPGRIPVTPAVLRSIFVSSRTPQEERSISRIAFFRFSGFLLSCLGISLAARARGGGATLLGVV